MAKPERRIAMSGDYRNMYGLGFLPEWRPMNDHTGNRMPGSDPSPRLLPLWSGRGVHAIPPRCSARVDVKINGFGKGTVIGYFVEHGFLGVYVKLDVRPDWHIRQTTREWCMVFGAEIDAIREGR